MGVILDKNQLTAGLRVSLNFRVTVAQKLPWRCYSPSDIIVLAPNITVFSLWAQPVVGSLAMAKIWQYEVKGLF